MLIAPTELVASIENCMLSDRPRLRKLAKNTQNKAGQILLETQIQASQQRAVERRQRIPESLNYPRHLPVVAARESIGSALRKNQVIVVCGDTGSGKTTQLPKICLAQGLGVVGQIAHTQPRRLAARTMASRIAEELGSEVGDLVGFKVRFSDHAGPENLIRVMTDGLLLAEIQQHKNLLNYDTIIIDEAHERSLNIDFLLGYLKQLLPKRPELRLIVTSATIDPESFSQYFDNAPIIHVEGRSYPVDIRYQPVTLEQDQQPEHDFEQTIINAINALSDEGPGDILVFLPGERAIRETRESLIKAFADRFEILPLYARLSATEQHRAFRKYRKRRIVLSTNVAETSVTVPGIRYVIDSGLARISRYSIRSKLQRLPIEAISQASAKQRAGRCGREAPGICLRLYEEADFIGRPAFTDPEILRTNLAAVILQMAAYRLGKIENFAFLSAPESKFINDGYQVLRELGAVDNTRKITKLGRQLAKLPIDPRLARMLVAANDQACLAEMLIIVSALAVQDPRDRPHQQRQTADRAHAQFQDENSDFLSLTNLWAFFEVQMARLSNSQLRKACAQNFISYLRMLEWRDVYHQLHEQVNEMGFHINDVAAGYASIHRAILAGLLSNIATREDKRQYLGTRNRSLQIFPASTLFKRNPRWIVAAEIWETSRVYARTVARIEAHWIEHYAQHLVSYSYFSPHWMRKTAQVSAFKKTSLYGLVINPKKRVNYSAVDINESRHIFIQEALVEGRFDTTLKFFSHNHAVLEQAAVLEDKARRRDIVLGPKQLFGFYDKRVPNNICSGASFHKWYKQENLDALKLLYFEYKDVVAYEPEDINNHRFPEHLQFGSLELSLEYFFEPGHPRDGITLRIPLVALPQVSAVRCEWLVPGLLEEKVIALLRALPKIHRRHFVPVPDVAYRLTEQLQASEQPLCLSLGEQLFAMTGHRVPPNAWSSEALEPHLRMHFELIDTKGSIIDSSRDLLALQQHYRAQALENKFEIHEQRFSGREFVRWDFGDLPHQMEIEQLGMRITRYPTLVANRNSVQLDLADNPAEATQGLRSGIYQLIRLQLHEQFKFAERKLPNINQLCLQFTTAGTCKELKHDILTMAIDRCFLQTAALPRKQREFNERITAGRGQVVDMCMAVCAQITPVLDAYHKIVRRINGQLPLSWIEPVADIKDQLSWLIFPNFLTYTGSNQLQQFQRYLKGIELRLNGIDKAPERDRLRRAEFLPLWEACKKQLNEKPPVYYEGEMIYELRWSLEELRIALFAQSLGTIGSISIAKVERALSKL